MGRLFPLLLTAFFALVFAAGPMGCDENGTSAGTEDDSDEVPEDAARLNWDPNEENDLAGYIVHIGTEPSNYTQSIDVGLTADADAPSHTVEDLEAGITYYFAVTAYDHSGNESGPSLEASKTMGDY